MSQSIIEQIEKAIEDRSEEYTKNSGAHGAVAKNFVRNDFLAGAQFILPLLKKAIEQRDAYPESDYPVNMCKNAIEHDNSELLKLLVPNE